jgi:hypothetical protein
MAISGKHRGDPSPDQLPIPRGERLSAVRAAMSDPRALTQAAVAGAFGAGLGLALSAIGGSGFLVGLGAAMAAGSSIGVSAREHAHRDRQGHDV